MGPQGHRLSMEVSGASAGRACCSCGWESDVLVDGLNGSGYSATDALRDWKVHLRSLPSDLDPVVDPAARPACVELPFVTPAQIALAVVLLIGVAVLLWL